MGERTVFEKSSPSTSASCKKSSCKIPCIGNNFLIASNSVYLIPCRGCIYRLTNQLVDIFKKVHIHMHIIQKVVEHDQEITPNKNMTDLAKEEEKKTAQDKEILDEEEEKSLSTKSASVVSGGKDADSDSDEDSLEDSSDAEAIALATKAADENYVPSQSLLNSSSPYPLIRSVDGISLKRYNPDPSVFCAKDVIVPLRGTLNVPIHVTTSGSIVDYTVDCAGYDIGFGITAEREEGVTVVKVCLFILSIILFLNILFPYQCTYAILLTSRRRQDKMHM